MRIKDIIKQKGLTAKDVAQKMGIQPSSLSRAINENPTVNLLKRIADVLDVPVTELLEQPATDVIHCPHCGGKIKIAKE
jgi:transcriptional regulator with XRE-family HTH domain